ncbi:MAG: DNA primase [Tepidanaerobacteraceae bacterium]
MGFYSEDIIKEVQERADIVEIISAYTSLQKRGNNYMGLCPFHTEKTPSFNVDVEKRLFYCFGCGTGGNIFTFIMKKENLSFPEAIRYLADKYHIRLPSTMDKELSQEFRERRKLLQINDLVAKYYNYCLFHTREGRNAISYIKRRGLTQETVEKFFLGYASPSWDGLIKFTRSKGIEPKELEKIGLIVPRKNSKGYYDRFRNRLIFPIKDITKNIIGFGGRALDASMPKYLNSPETPLFSKGDNLYGLSVIKKDSSKDVIVVEGYMDCITLHQHGFNQTVATLGTALTKKQAKLLKKYTDTVILSYDADEAGQAAAMRGMEVLAQEGLRVKILNLPEGKDPDEVIQDKGRKYFQTLINDSIDLITFKLNSIKKTIDIKTSDGKLKFLKQAIKVLAEIDNQPEMDLHVIRLAKELGISAESIKKEIKSKILPNNGYEYKKSQIRDNNKQFNEILQVTGIYKAERKILKLVLENEEAWGIFKEQLEPQYFTNKNTRKIADVLFKMFNKVESIDIPDIYNYLDEEGSKELSTILMETTEIKDEELIDALIKKVKYGYLKDSITQVRKQMKRAEILGQREEINNLLYTYQQLKAEMEKLNTHTTPRKKEGL